MNAKNWLPALACTVLMAISSLAHSAELAADRRTEIEYLLARLGNSNCEFNRNGSWYSAAEAREHLTMKFDYLVKKNLLKTSEDFIDLGAAKSSMSGKAYQVKCGAANAVDSAVWLREELAQYRLQQVAK